MKTFFEKYRVIFVLVGIIVLISVFASIQGCSKVPMMQVSEQGQMTPVTDKAGQPVMISKSAFKSQMTFYSRAACYAMLGKLASGGSNKETQAVVGVVIAMSGAIKQCVDDTNKILWAKFIDGTFSFGKFVTGGYFLGDFLKTMATEKGIQFTAEELKDFNVTYRSDGTVIDSPVGRDQGIGEKNFSSDDDVTTTTTTESTSEDNDTTTTTTTP